MKYTVLLFLVFSSSFTSWASDPEEDIFYDTYDTDQRAYEFGKCPICWDNKKLDGTLQCGHTYCKPCIQTSYQTNQNCPSCAKRIQTIDGQPPIKGPEYVYNPYEAGGMPAQHRFKFVGDHIVVALQYQDDVMDFIHSLTQDEYLSLMDAFRWRPGALEAAIGGYTMYGDPTVLSLEDRRALLLHHFGIPVRPEYRPWISAEWKLIPLGFGKLEALQRLGFGKLETLQRQRNQNNERAREEYLNRLVAQ